MTRGAAVLLVGLGALLVGLYACQSKLVYHPWKGIDATPADVGLDYDDVRIETEDGETVHGFYVPHDSARATLLLCHGNAGNVSNRVPVVGTLHRLGVSVLVFDYRGFGLSTGSPDEQGTYRDARAAHRHLVERRGVSPDRIVIYGKSLGGAVASRLAAEVPNAAVVLDSAFSSIEQFAVEAYPLLPVRSMLRYEYPTAANVEQLDVPLLVIHSRNDGLIPFEHAKRIVEAGGERARLVEARGAHNDDHLREPAVARAFVELLETSVP